MVPGGSPILAVNIPIISSRHHLLPLPHTWYACDQSGEKGNLTDTQLQISTLEFTIIISYFSRVLFEVLTMYLLSYFQDEEEVPVDDSSS